MHSRHSPMDHLVWINLPLAQGLVISWDYVERLWHHLCLGSGGCTWMFNPHVCGSKPMGSHFGVGAPPIFVYLSGDWDVHWGYGILTHGHISWLPWVITWEIGGSSLTTMVTTYLGGLNIHVLPLSPFV